MNPEYTNTVMSVYTTIKCSLNTVQSLSVQICFKPITKKNILYCRTLYYIYTVTNSIPMRFVNLL